MEEEEDPSAEYIRAYNDGYQLAKHDPILWEEISKSPETKNHSYIKAMEQGAEQHHHETLMTEMKQARMTKKMKRPRIR